MSFSVFFRGRAAQVSVFIASGSEYPQPLPLRPLFPELESQRRHGLANALGRNGLVGIPSEPVVHVVFLAHPAAPEILLPHLARGFSGQRSEEHTSELQSLM